jgi:hypothetical protein
MLLQDSAENATTAERRTMRRFHMSLPASVRVPGIPVPFETKSEDMSARGVFFYIDRWMKEGSLVEVTVDFPSQVTLAEPVRVRCNARIVRVVESQNPMRVGVAAVIDACEFVGQNEQASAELQAAWSFSTSC